MLGLFSHLRNRHFCRNASKHLSRRKNLEYTKVRKGNVFFDIPECISFHLVTMPIIRFQFNFPKTTYASSS